MSSYLSFSVPLHSTYIGCEGGSDRLNPRWIARQPFAHISLAKHDEMSICFQCWCNHCHHCHFPWTQYDGWLAWLTQPELLAENNINSRRNLTHSVVGDYRHAHTGGSHSLTTSLLLADCCWNTADGNQCRDHEHTTSSSRQDRACKHISTHASK